MHIEFIYQYIWTTEQRAYYVTYDDGVTVVRVFANGEIGAVVNPVPPTRMAEIQAHIDEVIASASSFPSQDAP
jgi:hypothetical protein